MHSEAGPGTALGVASYACYVILSGAKGRSVDAAMITLKADFNHLDPQGRLRLEDLRMHKQTPFAEIAAKHEPIIFVDGEDMVRGELAHDPQLGWIGNVDWSKGRLGIVPNRRRWRR
jgi:hypothetical protein